MFGFSDDTELRQLQRIVWTSSAVQWLWMRSGAILEIRWVGRPRIKAHADPIGTAFDVECEPASGSLPAGPAITFLLNIVRLMISILGFTRVVQISRAIVSPFKECPVNYDLVDKIATALNERAARSVLVANDCKTTAVVAALIFGRMGYRPTLVVGVSPHPVAFHSWTQVGSKEIPDSEPAGHIFEQIVSVSF